MHFLFLEIKDQEIVSFLTSLRFSLSKKNHKTSIHITIAGPKQKKPKPLKTIERFLREGHLLKISGIDRFVNHEDHVIYLAASISGLRTHKLWNKPHYPKFNPHITLYKGNDAAHADKIFRYLQNEPIALETDDYTIIPYCSEQPDLLHTTEQPLAIQYLADNNQQILARIRQHCA